MDDYSDPTENETPDGGTPEGTGKETGADIIEEDIYTGDHVSAPPDTEYPETEVEGTNDSLEKQLGGLSAEGVGDQRVNIFAVNDPTGAIWNPESQEFGDIYGHPEEDLKHWHKQNNEDTCAIVSQEYILDSFSDYDFSEEELINEAIKKGYYIPGSGTLPYYVGNLLEDHGIEVQRSEGNTIDDIKEKLIHEQKIIVGVDANEIWAPSEFEQLKDLYFMPEANHAVMVTGYNDETQTVTLNDPGHPNGAGIKVALNDFENAWHDANCFMVTANKPSQMVA
jgi:hypothetical protein